MSTRTNRSLQMYRGTFAWMIQRISALVLVVVVPLRMYTGYGVLGKVPWFKAGSAAGFHMNTTLDITMLLCILLHAFYGIRVMLIDVGWIREDKFFWRTTILALGLFSFFIYYLYLRK